MDPKRIAQLRKHLQADAAENVDLHAKDFCDLVNESGSDDPGLLKAAAAMAKHVGFVAISRRVAGEMLDRLSTGGGTQSTGGASGTRPEAAKADKDQGKKS